MSEFRDDYSRITGKIVADLEQGVRPWHRPWNAEHLAGRVSRPPRHNDIAYQGINVLVLWCAGVAKRLRLLTFRQVLALGGNVKKCERGELVVYANRITRTEIDDKGKESERENAFFGLKDRDPQG